MKPTMFLAFALSVLASTGHASVISTETATRLIQMPTDLGFSCKPGVAPNGHNFPTYSDVSTTGAGRFFVDTNVTELWTVDPKFRMGNHCPELAGEFAAALPAQVTLTRRLVETVRWENGRCVKRYDETVEGRVGEFELRGSESFTVGEVPTGCAQPN